MTEVELLAIVEQEEANSLSTTTGKLAEQRRQALQYYYGEPYGNEVEGRSQVVTTEVKDAVEEILPALMKIFTSSDDIVRFDPKNPDDEAKAQQATDYVNYIFTQQNNGFVVLYCIIKDALLLKNGFAKIYWENYEDHGKETYEGLNDIELMSLMQDPELELLNHTDVQDPMQGVLHDAVFRRSKKYGKVCIDPLPPEEVLVSRETPNDLTKARFIEHRTLRTISEIREMGFKVDDDIADYAPNAEFNMERYERNRNDDAWSFNPDRGNNDKTTRRVWLCEAYLYVDFDGDGIAEFRKVTKVGRNILDNVEFDSLPIVGGTTIMMPHKHYGLSIHDLINDIQLIKSTVTRQLLDNAYLANNGRYAVMDGMVNMDDLLTNRPGGIVRMKTLGAVQRLDTPLLGQPAFQLLEYFDRIRQSRIGVMDLQDWTDPNLLNAKATTTQQVGNASMQRIELMARILAETVVKDLFSKILELISKHQQKPTVVKLRGQWVEIDPRDWYNKFDMTITVGLGTGSQATTLQGAMGIMQIQQGMLQAGMGRLASEKNVYSAAHKYAKSVFPKDADAFFTDPTTLPPPQQQPNPELMKIQLAAQKAAQGNKQKYDKMMMDYQLALKQIGLQSTALGLEAMGQVATQAHEKQMQENDSLHEHVQNTLEHVVNLHQGNINRPQDRTTQS